MNMIFFIPEQAVFDDGPCDCERCPWSVLGICTCEGPLHEECGECAAHCKCHAEEEDGD